MKKINAGLWLAAAVSLAVFGLACGDPGPNDGGSGCTTDSSCATGKMCHPVLKQCVPTCTGGSDCPSTAKTCATWTGAAAGDGGVLAFCQCATDQLCGGGNTVCMAATKTCENKCTSSSCWGGASCNSTTGQCGAGGTDAGADAGTCTFGSCATGVCNTATSQCENKTCSAANQEPDSCNYGQYCASNNACYEVDYGSAQLACANFTPGTGKTPVWSPLADTGPIIYDVSKTTADTAWCGTGATLPADFSVNLRAYNKNSTFAATGATLPANTLFYVRSDGSQIDVIGLFRPVTGYTPSTDRKDLTMKMNFCGSGSATTVPVGFYFAGGNEYCVSITK